MIRIQEEKINYAEESRKFSKKNKSSGSISSFLGKVRKESINGVIESIKIEHYKNQMMLNGFLGCCHYVGMQSC